MGSQLPLKLSLSTSDLSSASIVEPGIIVRTEKSDSSTLPPLTAFVTGFTVPKSIRADNCVNPTSKVVPILTTFEIPDLANLSATKSPLKVEITFPDLY